MPFHSVKIFPFLGPSYSSRIKEGQIPLTASQNVGVLSIKEEMFFNRKNLQDIIGIEWHPDQKVSFNSH